jgi:hypothetical protein
MAQLPCRLNPKFQVDITTFNGPSGGSSTYDECQLFAARSISVYVHRGINNPLSTSIVAIMSPICVGEPTWEPQDQPLAAGN